MKKIPKIRDIDTARREAMLARIERVTELPLLILAFVMIPLLIGPYLWDLSDGEDATFIALDAFIWVVFAIDLGIKTAVAPHRLNYLRKHWLDVIIVAIPFFRPLRILRLFVFGSRALFGARRLVNVDFLFVYGIGMVMIAATAVFSVEENQADSSITSFPEALWWGVVTITTVGYGDAVPVTAAGRAIAMLLMIGGIAFFSGVTANLASYLVRMPSPQSNEKEVSQLIEEIRSLKGEVVRLREAGE